MNIPLRFEDTLYTHNHAKLFLRILISLLLELIFKDLLSDSW